MCNFCKENMLKINNIVKLGTILIIQVLHIAADLIAITFHSGSNYNYNLIIKELAEELKEKFNFLGENTDKYKIFPVRIEKGVTRTDKN